LTRIFNLSDIPEPFADNPEFQSGLMAHRLGKLTAESVHLYMNIDKLQPGTGSAKFHSHNLKEELFLMLEETGKPGAVQICTRRKGADSTTLQS
jgi:uncharacterized cupin superfamily protein